MTKNFKLDEFIVSRFYNKSNYQQEVWISYFQDEDFIYNNLKDLSSNLQALRDHFKKPIHINIAYRPKWYEALNNRSGDSQHCLGKAADIVVDGYDPSEVAEAIELLIEEGKMTQGGLKAYSTFTHYDVRGYKARW